MASRHQVTYYCRHVIDLLAAGVFRDQGTKFHL